MDRKGSRVLRGDDIVSTEMVRHVVREELSVEGVEDRNTVSNDRDNLEGLLDQGVRQTTAGPLRGLSVRNRRGDDSRVSIVRGQQRAGACLLISDVVGQRGQVVPIAVEVSVTARQRVARVHRGSDVEHGLHAAVNRLDGPLQLGQQLRARGSVDGDAHLAVNADEGETTWYTALSGEFPPRVIEPHLA